MAACCWRAGIRTAIEPRRRLGFTGPETGPGATRQDEGGVCCTSRARSLQVVEFRQGGRNQPVPTLQLFFGIRV
jgi:hypothetical protein